MEKSLQIYIGKTQTHNPTYILAVVIETTFSSIVYSQGLCIRRIVGDNYKIVNHLDKLKQAFFKAFFKAKSIKSDLLNNVNFPPIR